MIAAIVPITRLPKSLHAFDYTVPEHLERSITVGQLVTIPFRQSNIFGLVYSVRDEADDTLKIVADIFIIEPVLQHIHLAQMEMMQQRYGVSIGTIAKMMLPPLQKRKLRIACLSPFSRETTKKNDETQSFFSLYTDETQHAELLTNVIYGTTLILVPEIYSIRRIFSFLSPEQQSRAVEWHSHLSMKEQFARWMQIRNGEKTIIIGTRGACLLPYFRLDTIILDYEHHEQHKHWDQAPRFHAKDMAQWLAHAYGATLRLMSHIPSCESYYAVHKKKMQGSLDKLPQRTAGVRIIDMTEERRAGRFAILADVIKDALRSATQDVFLYINRRGFSSSAGCNRCGYIARCPTCDLSLVFHESMHTLRCHYCNHQEAFSLSCPGCHAESVALRGAGTEFITAGVKTFFKDDKTKDIIRIDSDLTHDLSTYHNDQRIIIGTSMAIPHIRWERTDAIICVDLDSALMIPEFRAAEQAWYMLNDLLYAKRPEATLYIQTTVPLHAVLRGLREPHRFYRTELNARRTVLYPPYTYLVRYFYAGTSLASAQTEAAQVIQRIRVALTEAKKTCIVSNPVEMHPKYFRGKFWYTFLVKLNVATATDDLVWLNAQIAHTWKIDPHPLSILHP